MPEPEPDRSTVTDAVLKAFPKDGDTVLKEMQWDSLNGCWMISRWGMMIGIEKDGYIHT